MLYILILFYVLMISCWGGFTVLALAQGMRGDCVDGWFIYCTPSYLHKNLKFNWFICWLWQLLFFVLNPLGSIAIFIDWAVQSLRKLYFIVNPLGSICIFFDWLFRLGK